MSQLEITFKKQAKTAIDSFILELDTEANSNKTSFQPNEPCYVKLFPGGLNPILTTTKGTASIARKKAVLDVEEYLIFAKEKEASLRYPLGELVSWEWDGRAGGTPSFFERRVVLAEVTSGILHVKYKSFYDQIQITLTEGSGKILLEATKGDRYGYITLDFQPQTYPVYLTVKDACSKAIIKQAQVFLNDVFVGYSDNEGRIYLGELPSGKYKIKILKEGYQPTDEDIIANDYLVIP